MNFCLSILYKVLASVLTAVHTLDCPEKNSSSPNYSPDFNTYNLVFTVPWV